MLCGATVTPNSPLRLKRKYLRERPWLRSHHEGSGKAAASEGAIWRNKRLALYASINCVEETILF